MEVCLTKSRATGLAQVAWRGHVWHHQVEGDGHVHGCHVVRASTDHANLIMGLEVNVWTACKHIQNDSFTNPSHRDTG